MHPAAHTDFPWPDPPLRIVLVSPQIPPNTGNVARLCAATGCELHLVEPLGFTIDDARLKRAGLDYWHAVDVRTHPDLETCLEGVQAGSIHYFSSKGAVSYFEALYHPGDILVFGAETTGLPAELLRANPDRVRTIPIRKHLVRSLNLSTSVGIVCYEALRQISGRA